MTLKSDVGQDNSQTLGIISTALTLISGSKSGPIVIVISGTKFDLWNRTAPEIPNVSRGLTAVEKDRPLCPAYAPRSNIRQGERRQYRK